MSDIIASVGVVILLIAFLLNLYKGLPVQNPYYKLMIFVGAALNAYASYMVRFYPFIILETVWVLMALLSLLKVPRETTVMMNNAAICIFCKHVLIGNISSTWNMEVKCLKNII